MGMGGCTSIDVIMMLEKARQDVHSCKVEITSERAETVPRVFTRIHVHFILEGNKMNPERVSRAIKLSADKYCSASIMPLTLSREMSTEGYFFYSFLITKESECL